MANNVLPNSTKLYINGKWTDPVKGKDKTIAVINPSTEKVICNVAIASEEDVAIAVSAAKSAFERTGVNAWSTLKGSERASYLRAISKKIAEKKDFLGRLEALDCGKPLREALWDMDDVAFGFDYYAGLAEKLDTRQNTPNELPDDRFKSVLQYAPVGVVAAIIPWNYPLLMAMWKVAPALAAGCTIVLKPSEITPLTALELAQIMHEVGLPAGVFNLLNGYGPVVGRPLVLHPDVDKVAFTGSVPTGRNIMTDAAKGIKKISLELGGKSALVIFDDVDLTEAVEWTMFGCFWTNGQICSATSRLLIHEKIAKTFLEKLAQEAKKITVGDPFIENDPSMGPLVSEAQWKKVLGYVEKGKKEGATLLTGGKRPDNLKTGYFLEPTVFVNVNENMSIWKEEIFGPVLSVMTFKTEEEAIRLANNTSYGLAAGVMSKDQSRCDRLAKQFRSGIVWINCSQPCFVQCPWGGMKQSGIGRELGPWGLDSYLEVKQVTSYVVQESGKWGWFIKSKL
eukprot:CAMPEP_0168557106 /NCGR_PEP_ID=MMETSP0413-20121227/9240_1 /TAXON_ID=136452 /ORGANISM="Filamoeba nolandi, Strain NC-AS-23-1" /LENGTH=509 /DNA_ID=CAMNT_0008588099 /DNA_START=54 /DNA_END=1583 /DNA_ORIENTATION=-